jgi:hypothetical protein
MLADAAATSETDLLNEFTVKVITLFCAERFRKGPQ